MHELSTVVRIVNSALEIAEANHAKSIKSIKVAIGEMTGILPEYVRKYYSEAVKGTILENAKIEIEMVPILSECSNCSTKFHPDKNNDYLCPNCKSDRCKIISGKSTEIVSVEIEDCHD